MTQSQTLEILKTGANIFLTGEPGAGKTYMLNQYIATLTTHRKSEYYLGLQERLNKNIKLTPAEYMIHAMVTENVNTLDPEALRQMTKYHNVQNFTANLWVLITMREWQNATDPAIKKESSKFYKDPLGFAMDRFLYFMCFKVNTCLFFL